MVEAGTFRSYDVLIVVDCPRALQIERLVEREGFTHQQAKKRVDAQLPGDEKKRHADFVIDTSGTLESTEEQVKELWKKLVAMADREEAAKEKE